MQHDPLTKLPMICVESGIGKIRNIIQYGHENDSLTSYGRPFLYCHRILAHVDFEKTKHFHEKKIYQKKEQISRLPCVLTMSKRSKHVTPFLELQPAVASK